MDEKELQQEEEVEIDLWVLFRDFFMGCVKFWWLVVLLAVIGAASMLFKDTGFYTPMYRSQATFTVTTNTSEDSNASYNFYYDSTTAQQLSLTFPYILSSDLLTDAIMEDMGTTSINGSISASVISDSNMITMSVISSDPQDAHDILESAIKVYPDVARFVIGATRFNMIDAPTLPTEPYNQPHYTVNFAKGALIGAGIGFAFIIVYAFLRKTVHKEEELRQSINLKCIASIPNLKQKRRKKQRKQPLPSILDRRIDPYFIENMDSLYLRIMREMNERKGKTILITSTVSGEGKSLISLNLAYELAKNKRHVLLIDADLRKQDLREQLHLPTDGEGLESLQDGVEAAVKSINYLEDSGIYFLGGSHISKDPSGLLSSKEMDTFMKYMKEYMDFVIIDAPPCEGFEDALILENYADGVLYIVKQDYVQKRRIIDSISMLSETQADLIGYVFNGVSHMMRGYGYGRYGSYGYYQRYGRYGKSYGYGHDQEKANAAE